MYPNTRIWPNVERSISVIATVVLLAVAVPALAGDSDANAAGTPSLEARLAAHIAAGDLTYRDPATNQVVTATEERVANLRHDLERHFSQPPVFNERVTADGAMVAVIGDAIRDVHLSRVNLDGTRTTACIRDLDAAVAFIVGLDTVENKAGDARPVAVSR